MLRQKTATGALWNFFLQLSTRGINALVTLLLARLLSPEDFGLVGMMAIFIAISSTLMDSGFKDALIRKKDANQRDFNTAFYANLLMGILSYGILYAAAPYIAYFYAEPFLIYLVRFAGIVIIINSFQLVQIANLSRGLNFKAQLKVSVPASIISGIVAVNLAYLGFGVWSLIIQMILMSLFTTVFLWAMRLWRPTLEYSSHSLKEMFNFGYKLFLSGLLDTIFRNLYIIIIAKLFAATIAGYYFFAEKIKEFLINQLIQTISTVTYPALSTIQDDNIRLKAGYRDILQVTTAVLFPAVIFLAALAEPLFRAFLPDTWLPAVSYLQFMCIAGLTYPLNVINLNILKVKGRSDLFLYLEIIKKMLIVLILAISIQFGIYGILTGQIVTSVLAYIPNSYYSTKLIKYSVKEQIADFLPALLLSVVIGLLAYLSASLSLMPPLAKLVIYGFGASIVYLVAGCLLKLNAFRLIKQLLYNTIKYRVVVK